MKSKRIPAIKITVDNRDPGSNADDKRGII